jgi:hypothetical protein
MALFWLACGRAEAAGTRVVVKGVKQCGALVLVRSMCRGAFGVARTAAAAVAGTTAALSLWFESIKFPTALRCRDSARNRASRRNRSVVVVATVAGVGVIWHVISS